jgi:hypothetical protein
MKSGHQLAPEGKILSGRKGVMDAPLAESKEAIAGYWFIYADSLEEAVEIAKGNPGLEYGQTIEVRPILPAGTTVILIANPSLVEAETGRRLQKATKHCFELPFRRTAHLPTLTGEIGRLLRST